MWPESTSCWGQAAELIWMACVGGVDSQSRTERVGRNRHGNKSRMNGRHNWKLEKTRSKENEGPTRRWPDQLWCWVRGRGDDETWLACGGASRVAGVCVRVRRAKRGGATFGWGIWARMRRDGEPHTRCGGDKERAAWALGTGLGCGWGQKY
jgi:hypothetical protein